MNAIAPGGTNTPLVRRAQIPADVDIELMKPFAGSRPMAEADEVAALFAYVASDEARSVHGNISSIDNGVTAG